MYLGLLHPATLQNIQQLIFKADLIACMILFLVWGICKSFKGRNSKSTYMQSLFSCALAQTGAEGDLSSSMFSSRYKTLRLDAIKHPHKFPGVCRYARVPSPSTVGQQKTNTLVKARIREEKKSHFKTTVFFFFSGYLQINDLPSYN